MLRRLLLLLALACAAPLAQAQCTSTGTGNWNNAGIWSCGRVPLASDAVTIANLTHTVTVNTATAVAASISFNGGNRTASLVIGTGNTLTVSGSVTINAPTNNNTKRITVNSNGTLLIGGNLTITEGNAGNTAELVIGSGTAGAVNTLVRVGGNITLTPSGGNLAAITFGDAGTLEVAGNFGNGGLLTAGNGTVVYNGSGAQNLGVYTYNALELDKSGGTATATGNITAARLSFAAGNAGIAAPSGTNTLTVTGNCTTAVTRTGGGYVDGRLRLTWPTGNPTCTYPVGDGGSYTPITVAITGSGGGTLTGSVTAADHPQRGGWPLSTSRYVRRYWSLDQAGDTLATLTSYTATLNWVAGDLQGGATPANFIAGQYQGGWVVPDPAVANLGATSLDVVNVTSGFATSVDFAVGEPFQCLPPANAPVAVTCVCDNFGRPNLNPSSIFGSNWLVSTSGGSFGAPRIINQGYLRLTDNTGNNASAATVPGIFPAAGNYISVEFKQHAYSGSGADGIAVTLSDYSVPPTPGGFGGSLGYAQRTGINGFAAGWIGVALDEYGNYTNPTEGRVGGPGFFPDNVSIRGSGANQTGYPYLGGVTNLGGFPVDNPGSTTPAPGYLYQIIVDARSYTSSSLTTLVSVNRDTTGTGNSYAPLLAPFDAYAVNPSQAPVPVNWQISFTGSTGGSTNIHEIGSLKICAQTILPPTASTTAANFNAIDGALSNTTQNAVFGRIYMKLANVPFNLNVAALLPPVNGVSPGVNTAYASGGSRNVTVRLIDDSAAGASCNSSAAACTACAKPVVATQTMTFTAADGGFKASPSFTVNGAYKRLIAQMSDGTSTGCSTDAFSVRPAAYALSTSVAAPTKAGTAFTITASPRDVNGNAIAGTPGQPTLDTTKVPAPAGTPTLMLQSWTPGAGAGSFLYNDVGFFNLPQNAIYDAQFGNAAAEAQDRVNGDCNPGSGTAPYVLNACNGYSGATCTNAAPWNRDPAGKYGCDIGSLPLNNVGRFYPDHYEAQVQFAPACSADGFSYMGQPFTMQSSAGVGVQIKALAAGQTFASAPGLPSFTSGYTPISSVWFGAQNGTGSTTDLMRCISATPNTSANRCALSSLPTKGAASTTWTAGVYTAPATTFYFDPPKDATTTPDATWGAYDSLSVGLTVQDPDGSTLTIPVGQSFVLNGDTYQSINGAVPTKMRYGRVRIDNATGSEQSPLSVPVRLEYWNGSGWAPNTLDATCTSLVATPTPFGGNGAPAACFGTCTSATAGGVGSLFTSRIRGVTANATTPSYANPRFSFGVRNVVLSAPKASGNLGLSLEVPSWLKLGPVNPTGANPAATIRFGTYNSRFIFLRENY
jgi:MSHA biogenesis protein MshQ